jgi:hypothetical protein
MVTKTIYLMIRNNYIYIVAKKDVRWRFSPRNHAIDPWDSTLLLTMPWCFGIPKRAVLWVLNGSIVWYTFMIYTYTVERFMICIHIYIFFFIFIFLVVWLFNKRRLLPNLLTSPIFGLSTHDDVPHLRHQTLSGGHDLLGISTKCPRLLGHVWGNCRYNCIYGGFLKRVPQNRIIIWWFGGTHILANLQNIYIYTLFVLQGCYLLFALKKSCQNGHVIKLWTPKVTQSDGLIYKE